MKKLTPHQRGLQGSDEMFRTRFSDKRSKPALKGLPTIAERLDSRVESLERMRKMVVPLFPQSELLEEIDTTLDVMREILEYQRHKDSEAGTAEVWNDNFRGEDLDKVY